MRLYGILVDGRLYVRTKRGNIIALLLLAASMDYEESAVEKTNRPNAVSLAGSR
ncbi:hypothetical protein [Paenibacillus helianthi]|uniref:hypothetical protein n=1 Tax=Paenibacillus helianthi TaxID=1349432 RepID=UPI000A9A3E0A|nr:hypothetical protein [Paenibacillus helianthi]